MQGVVPASHTLLHVLLSLAAILLACRFVGAVFIRIKQPPVIGEVIAGILLGPSLLGQISPQAMEFTFPQATTSYLGVVAQIGVILYLFLVGLELNTALLRRHASATALISHTSIVVPFLLGSTLAHLLYRDYAAAGRSFHRVRPLHGRGDGDYCFPGACPHFDRPGAGPYSASACSPSPVPPSTTSRPGACLPS